jgi:glycosyltransferase involved in cell wall biosynthesis
VRVLVCHPTRQHAGEVARALADANYLEGFLTLLPDERTFRWLPAPVRRALPRGIARNAVSHLPKNSVHCFLGPLLVYKGARYFERGEGIGDLLAWTLFDLWAAKHVRKWRPDAVVGYEMCSVATFKAAKSVGARCILDAAACHYTEQDSVLFTEKHKFSRAETMLRWRKRAELELADLIICCSELARQSYLAAGISRSRIVVNSPGVDVDLFRPNDGARRTGPMKFVFVGTASRTKGFDVLSEAFRITSNAFPPAELHVIGDPRPVFRLKEQSSDKFVIHGKLSHHELGQLLGMMDCLVLPSRLESFGLAVVEALAAGIPAIVTPKVGAAEVITAGKNGWIVPVGSAGALSKQMSSCCAEPSRAREMRPVCIASAARYQWIDYRKRMLSIVEAVVSSHRGSRVPSDRWPNRRDDSQAFSLVRNGDGITTPGRAYRDWFPNPLLGNAQCDRRPKIASDPNIGLVR